MVQNVIYYGIFIDKESKNKLKSLVPRTAYKVYCDHMTLAHSSTFTDEVVNICNGLLGKEFTITATTIGKSKDAMAVGIETDCFSVNNHKHITLCTLTPSSKPVQSNYIENWKKLKKPIVLKGTVMAFTNNGLIKENKIMERIAKQVIELLNQFKNRGELDDYLVDDDETKWTRLIYDILVNKFDMSFGNETKMLASKIFNDYVRIWRGQGKLSNIMPESRAPKKLIRLTESDLHKIVKESVNRILSEIERSRPGDIPPGDEDIYYHGDINPDVWDALQRGDYGEDNSDLEALKALKRHQRNELDGLKGKLY